MLSDLSRRWGFDEKQQQKHQNRRQRKNVEGSCFSFLAAPAKPHVISVFELNPTYTVFESWILILLPLILYILLDGDHNSLLTNDDSTRAP